MAPLPLGIIPTDLNDLTPEWMTAALVLSGELSTGPVETVSVVIGAKWHIAQTGCVSVTYSPDMSVTLPNRFFVKLAMFDDPLEAVLPGENAFYRRTHPGRLPLPRCYGAFFDPKTSLSCLILQDLSKTHETTPWPLQLSQPNSRTAVEALAVIHGRCWDRPGMTASPDVDALIANENALSKDFQTVLPAFFDYMGDRLSIDRQHLMSRAFERFPELKAKRLHDGRPTTIVHGDAHAWNVMFPNDRMDQSCIFVDWEDWRFDAGAADLAYMMALNWHQDRRTRYECDLLKHYHEILSGHIDDQYVWDDLMLDYKIGLIQHVVVPVYLQQFRPTDAIWLEHLERWFIAMEDLDCHALL